MFNQGKRNDWNIADCDVEQWRSAFKHLAMSQAIVTDATISRVETSVIAGISESLNSLHFALVTVYERLK